MTRRRRRQRGASTRARSTNTVARCNVDWKILIRQWNIYIYSWLAHWRSRNYVWNHFFWVFVVAQRLMTREKRDRWTQARQIELNRDANWRSNATEMTTTRPEKSSCIRDKTNGPEQLQHLCICLVIEINAADASPRLAWTRTTKVNRATAIACDTNNSNIIYWCGLSAGAPVNSNHNRPRRISFKMKFVIAGRQIEWRPTDG